ncbi:hypothetical protein HAHE_03160 [Haloferula helveola]|uniref:Uncharacterized protein n=1 Tax=Haloferula helveola TaxID=490095 RepID=A0ABM7R6Z9_9BACT|nr:hypothetical protein HAHE_03160 [Haloferula helveola]
MPSLHLLNQEGPEFPQPAETAPGVMESGYWLVSEDRACATIGNPIHFHRRKKDPAFLSGTVTEFRRDYYPPGDPKAKHRTVFIFTPDPHPSGSTTPDGWTPAGVKFIP